MSLAKFINTSFEPSRFSGPAATADESNYVLRATLWDDAAPAGWNAPPRERQHRNSLPPGANDAKTGTRFSRMTEVAEHGFFVVTLLVTGALNVGAVALLAQLA